ncbi:hypothetical protein [Streptomyces sp. SID13031]|uniref:hypothetical protein n=1 Tax=Streptomyces sp. SID13031 TaxID=2706046 RepID=UPI0013CAD4B7|nr:hypothetical protein [Streptomyces sp. SID13031]NEA32023.1 hypothetical protein [Streptomyces sp. SID13031]
MLGTTVGRSKEAINFCEQCIHITRGEARIVERIYLAEQRVFGGTARHQLIEVASGIERATGWIR